MAAPVGLLLELTDLLPLLQEAPLLRPIDHRDPGRGRAMIQMAFARLDGWKAQEIEQHDRLNDAGVDGRPPGIVN
ncbi:hypothetical protein [Thermogemmatispora tikiterensis]|uniref:hypothetical protein n=1 Tax=Thermogemmatispora tikiterensis TaxID=1825093 RepID=UPI0011BE960C|nr:hypothetical protein [Thermogemmatispora tikiterensis]